MNIQNDTVGVSRVRPFQKLFGAREQDGVESTGPEETIQCFTKSVVVFDDGDVGTAGFHSHAGTERRSARCCHTRLTLGEATKPWFRVHFRTNPPGRVFQFQVWRPSEPNRQGTGFHFRHQVAPVEFDVLFADAQIAGREREPDQGGSRAVMSDLPASSWMKGRWIPGRFPLWTWRSGPKCLHFVTVLAANLPVIRPILEACMLFSSLINPCLNVVTPILDVVPPGGVLWEPLSAIETLAASAPSDLDGDGLPDLEKSGFGSDPTKRTRMAMDGTTRRSLTRGRILGARRVFHCLPFWRGTVSSLRGSAGSSRPGPDQRHRHHQLRGHDQ